MLLSPLYHWSPRERRDRIRRRGLVPTAKPRCSAGGTYQDGRLVVCLAPSPRVAWALSAAVRGEKGETWDLWEVDLEQGHDEVHVVGHWGARIQEVRVANPIPKRRVWWVGERTI